MLEQDTDTGCMNRLRKEPMEHLTRQTSGRKQPQELMIIFMEREGGNIGLNTTRLFEATDKREGLLRPFTRTDYSTKTGHAVNGKILF